MHGPACKEDPIVPSLRVRIKTIGRPLPQLRALRTLQRKDREDLRLALMHIYFHHDRFFKVRQAFKRQESRNRNRYKCKSVFELVKFMSWPRTTLSVYDVGALKQVNECVSILFWTSNNCSAVGTFVLGTASTYFHHLVPNCILLFAGIIACMAAAAEEIEWPHGRKINNFRRGSGFSCK